MDSSPLVDIIITTRNNESILRKNLESIAQQTFSGYQCYVIDDCSDDDTITMLKDEFPRVKVLKNKKRKGPSHNRNIAITKGKAPFIVTLDDDVELTSNWLKEMVESISLSPVIGVVGSQLRFFNSKDTLNGIGGVFGADGLGGDLFFNTPIKEVENLIEKPMRIVYACSAAMIMRRDAFEKAGGFDSIYFYLAEDYDLGLRINFCGYLVEYNPKAIAYHHYHAVANTFPNKTVKYLYYRNSLRTILKNFSNNDIKNILFEFIRRHRQEFLLVARSFIWNSFHLPSIIKWRKYTGKQAVINKSQIHILNTYISSLRLARSVPQKKHQSKYSWQHRLWDFPFNICSFLGKNMKKISSKRGYVDNIILLITNICNARCKHCFLIDSLNKEPEKNLTLLEIRNFFSSLGMTKNIVLGGGEPFLREDIERICMTLEEVSKPESFTIPTNGFSPEVIFKKVKTILENTQTELKISLSIDGPAELHDEIRQKEGLFNNAKETYERLSFLYYIFYPRLTLQVNSVVFADNYSSFLELHSLIKEEFPLANSTFEIIRGHYDSATAKPITDGMYKDLIKSIRQIDKTNLDNSLELHDLALKTIESKAQVIPCNAGQNFIVLDFSGNLYPCEALPAFINVRDIDYDFARVVEDPRWHKSLKDIEEGKCYCTYMCFLASSLNDVQKKQSAS